MFQREPRHTPQIEPMSKHIHQSQVVRRRQVRIGIRGRIVTVEVRQAIIGTIVSIAGAKRRTKTRNLPPKRGSPLSKSCTKIRIFRYTPYTKYKKPPSAVLRATAEVSISNRKQVCQRTVIGRTCGARVLARWLRHLRGFSRLVVVLISVNRRARVEVSLNLAERRRQVRIGIRGRKVTVEARQAIRGTKASSAGAKRRTKTRSSSIEIRSITIVGRCGCASLGWHTRQALKIDSLDVIPRS